MSNKVISWQTLSFWCARSRLFHDTNFQEIISFFEDAYRDKLFKGMSYVRLMWENPACESKCSMATCPIWKRLKDPFDYVKLPQDTKFKRPLGKRKLKLRLE